jgi:hypothetical protein
MAGQIKEIGLKHRGFEATLPLLDGGNHEAAAGGEVLDLVK